MGRILYEGFDVVELAEVVASSNSKRDPVQWPELFKSGRAIVHNHDTITVNNRI